MRTRIDVTERGTRDSAAGVARAGRGKGRRRGEEVRTGPWVPGRVVRQFGRGGRAICRQMWAQARIVVSWAERDDDAG